MDDLNTLASARRDPKGFVEALPNGQGEIHLDPRLVAKKVQPTPAPVVLLGFDDFTGHVVFENGPAER